MAKRDQIKEIDILAMEMEQKLPYWLSPQQRYAHTHDEARKRNRQRWLDEQKAKRRNKDEAS
jgi:hypothetical protein